MVKITTVFNELKQEFTQLRAEVEKRKSKLSAIAKESDRFLAQYGEETNEMVKLLNKTRDEQVIDNKNRRNRVLYFNALFCYLLPITCALIIIPLSRLLLMLLFLYTIF